MLIKNAYIDRVHKILFFWSPKVACTSIANWFLWQVLSESTRATLDLSISSDARVLLKEHMFLLDSRDLKRQDLSDYKKIAFVRNPYDRAVSAFCNKFIFNREKFLTTFDDLEEFAQDIYTLTADRSKAYAGLSFLQFLENVKNQIAAGHPVDHHWAPQQRVSICAAQYDYIFPIEEMAKANHMINDLIGKETEIKNFNKMTYAEQEGLFDGPVSQLSSLEIAMKGVTPDKKYFLNSETKNLIVEIYKNDFIDLGYPY
ncbi:sulfotransferase family 2 domain-containing protein [Temperatibacter marinus]|uniref:Sulfotransferase family 2 domain-containing protein n=1 Tax=Temperatibacter marinus TaxID=1456591 RepID=A0AA52EI50_9PROT|nr:sulfotransferase family 2 domain-containing protein [Temperatibacter marinus]WND03220.1 sulfotransferase family 2 domain-containing protein [Temperatibacter marinus]